MRNDELVYIGNWDIHKASPRNGFAVFHRDGELNRFILLSTAFPEISVGATCFHPRLPILYCVDETKTLPNYYQGGGGQVYSLAINPHTGELTEINHLPSYGVLPSSVAVDATGSYLIVTHHTDRVPITTVTQSMRGEYEIALVYDDATTVLFPLDDQGRVLPPCDVHKHHGEGGPLPRQTHPQLHSVTMAPSGEFFVICDKGNDLLTSLSIDAKAARFAPEVHHRNVLPGSSPRYVAFHPYRPWMFINYEMKCDVSTFAHGPGGYLTHIHTISSLPEGVIDTFSMKQSDIKVHPSGRYVYSLIRGIDSISMFVINDQSGRLRRMQTLRLGCQGPRACAISRDGKWMYIAALASQEVLACEIAGTGELTPRGIKCKQPNPGTLNFF